MPQRKSAATLKTLCMETLQGNLDALQHKAKYLPKPIINELHDKCCKIYDQMFWSDKYKLPLLPADLFFDSRTRTVYPFDYFDRSVDKIVDKINGFCKNIRIICLEKHIDRFSATISNPHILEIDLSHSDCSDYHLSIIGEECRQLRCLKLLDCEFITDEGMNFLPQKIQVLYLPEQITTKAHLMILRSLRELTDLYFDAGWDNIIEAFATTFANTVGDQTYEINSMRFELNRPLIYDHLHSVVSLFPKLRKIGTAHQFSLTSLRVLGVDFLEAVGFDLLTDLNVQVTPDFVQIGSHCPMLENFYVQVIGGNRMVDEKYLIKPNHRPYRHLRKLGVYDDFKLTMDDLSILLSNCVKLEFLVIDRCDQVSDQLVYDVLLKNPLKNVEYLKFYTCRPFSIKALVALLKSLDLVKCFLLCNCLQISRQDQVTVSDLSKEMNWDLVLEWD